MKETLVILGAGASYDSLNFFNSGCDNLTLYKEYLNKNPFRPPLVNDLFKPLYLENLSVGESLYTHALSLASTFQRMALSGADFEIQMTKIYEQIKNSAAPAVARESDLKALIDVVYYLQELFVHCSRKFIKQTSNYHDLVRRLYGCNDSVTFVTFNYDCLLERALNQHVGVQFKTIDDYVKPECNVIKLHGSCNWGYTLPPRFSMDGCSSLGHRMVDVDGVDSLIGYLGVLDEGMMNVVELKSDSDDCLFATGGHGSLFPAMLLPLSGTGDYFEKRFICPSFQLDVLKNKLLSVKKILIIGWSGNESHFLKFLNDNCNVPGMSVQIVGASGVEETHRLLGSCFSGAGFPSLWNDGFSHYLQNEDNLEIFLN